MNCFVVLFIFCLLILAINASENVCGDWETYKEEKCIKLFDKVGTLPFSDAEKTCNSNEGSTLLSINYADEQAFLVDYLFSKNKVVDSIWLGAKFTETKVNNPAHFQWKDGRNLTFTNWAAGNPKNHSDFCVQMHAEEELRGKWSNEPCTKKNLVVCEKSQTWSMSKMQELIKSVMQNPVPIGFIYVQLPKEEAPTSIWPWMVWTDVSYIYTGVFFRVGGGGAADFGTVQEDFSPFIDYIVYEDCQVNSENKCNKDNAQLNHFWEDKIPRSGGWSKNVITSNGFIGYSASHFIGTLKFHTAPGEVRPRNMAIRVWKRTA